jgi:RNA recognition motif-containing protein
MNIYVANLGVNIGDQDLKELFAKHGAVTSAKVIMDKFTNQSRGFGFVEMSDDGEARKALEDLNGAMVDNVLIKVSEARPREDRSQNYNSNSNSNRRY